MRVHPALVVGAVLFLCLHGMTAAASPAKRTGDYAAIRAIGGFSAVGGIDHTDSGTLQIRHDSDIVGGTALVLGYDWIGKGVPVRSEIEYHHRFRFDFDTRIVNGTDAGFENQLSTDAFLVNVFYDFHTSRFFKPYVGAGAGWSINTSDVDRVPLSGGSKEERKDSKGSLAWALMLGGFIDLSEGWQFEVGYRYIDLGEVESGPFADGTVITAKDYTSHDLILGVLYRF